LSLTLLLCVFGGTAQAQTFNIYEGLGVLENGWQNYSNCSVNLQSSAYVLENSYSCQVQYTAGGQSFSLGFPSGFTSQYLTAVSFYINEGTVLTRNVNVSITVNGVQSAAVSMNSYLVGTLKAQTWIQVLIPLTKFGVGPGTGQTVGTISGIKLQESAGVAEPAFWVGQMGWPPVTPPYPVAIGVDPQEQLSMPTGGVRTVDPKMFGVNTAVWDSGFNSIICQNLVARADFRAFRFPGGSLSDTYHWQTNLTNGDPYTWATDFDQFASTVPVRNAQGQGFITVNYGTGTPAEAAAWVQYSNVTKRYGMKYWELGNEVYGTWETDSHAKPNDPVTYAQQYAQFYTAMKAVDPTIKIGAVAAAGQDSYVNYPSESVQNPVTHQYHSGWTAVMLSTLAGLGVTPDYLIYHRYPEYDVDCDYTLLTGNGGWAADMQDMRLQLDQYLGYTNADKVQLMCTENNADAGTPGKQLTSLVNGVYMADSFGQLLDTESNSYMWWDLINGQGTNPADGPWLYGWRTFGDEGMFSPDFTQTYPIYYAEQIVNQFASPGDGVVIASSTYGLLTAYAVDHPADGSVHVMVVNLNPTATITAVLTFGSGQFTPANTATEFQYGMNQDNAAQRGQTQSIAVSYVGGVSSSTAFSFPPYSISVLVFPKLTVHTIGPGTSGGGVHPGVVKSQKR
jgi:alpha-N-arabinofuranosidase